MASVFALEKFLGRPAIVCEDGTVISYTDLCKETKSLAATVNQGLVFVLCTNTIGSLVGYVSFINNNTPILLLDGQKDIDIIKYLIQHYSPRYLWMPSIRFSELGTGIPRYEYQNYTLVEMPFRAAEIHSDIALLLTTSGSTGSPKLVKLSKANIISNAESIAEYLDITSSERPITSLPMYYSYGLSVINSHLIKGATILLTDKAVIQKEFWEFAKRERATSIAGVPYTYEMLRRLRFFKMDLPYMKTLTQAGGKLNAKIVEEFIRNAEECGKRFFVMYGQTEATARMSYLPQEHALEKYSSIGIAIPGGSFFLMDINGNEIIDHDVDGELIYKGPNVSLGYAENIADLSIGDENHGVLHTGDIARRDADGYYYITGRMKRFVKVWGNRCNLDAIEQLVKNITTNCACAGVDDKITVFVTEAGLENKIINYLSNKMGLNIRAFAVKVVASIPQNASGKILYAELQKMLE